MDVSIVVVRAVVVDSGVPIYFKLAEITVTQVIKDTGECLTDARRCHGRFNRR